MSLDHAEHLLDLGRPEAALEALAGAGDEATSARAHCLQALAFLSLKKPREAAKAAGRARAVEPQSGDYDELLNSLRRNKLA